MFLKKELKGDFDYPYDKAFDSVRSEQVKKIMIDKKNGKWSFNQSEKSSKEEGHQIRFFLHFLFVSQINFLVPNPLLFFWYYP